MSYNASMKNRYKLFNIIFFIAWIILFLFEIIKICIYSSHRELYSDDYLLLSVSFEYLILFSLWFVFASMFEHKGKFRKTSIIFFSICSICSLGYINRKFQYFKLLFFPKGDYIPVFMDQFTTLFEVCWVGVFAIIFTTYFIILLCKKHFKKSS